jgi:hypothetical protein
VATADDSQRCDWTINPATIARTNTDGERRHNEFRREAFSAAFDPLIDCRFSDGA